MATASRVVTDAAGSTAELNGLRVYYEVHGEGRPIVLLHGGVGASEVFGSLVPGLADSRRVILMHLQAHGRTSDADRPLRFESMADDVAALIGHLGLESADVFGYSLGGGVALQTAIRHPEVVRSLMVVSAPVRRLGWYPEVLQGMSATPLAADAIAGSPLGQMYPDHDWRTHLRKLADLLDTDYDWSEQVGRIDRPMMIAFADSDSVTLAHIAEFYSLLGGGQRDAGMDASLRPAARLAVLPGTTHYDIVASPLLAETVQAFLDWVDRRR